MTTTSTFLILTLVLLAAAGPGKDAASERDHTGLQGTWLTVSLVNDGKTLVDEEHPPKEGPVTKLVYDGDRWLVKVDGTTGASGICRVDAAKTAKEIDILDASGVRNNKAKLGIYELSGDMYRYCLAPAGEPRPAEFASKTGSGTSLGAMR